MLNAHRIPSKIRKLNRPQPSRRSPFAGPAQAHLAQIQRAIVQPVVVPPSAFLALQQVAGNRAVTGLIQTKLTVGPPGDRYEQEADRVAEQVVSYQPSAVGDQRSGGGSPGVRRQEMPEEEEVQMQPLAATITPLVQRQGEEEEEIQAQPLVQRQEEEVQAKSLIQRQEDEKEEIQAKSLIQRQEDEEEEIQATSLIQRQEEEEEEVQTKSRSRLSASPLPDLEQRLAAQRGSGRPLPVEVRAFMEPRFGVDFGGVRVHTDGEATHLNRQLNSKAFTHGQDIYFRGGEYNPETPAGQRLLAHELTHTIQQGATPKRIQGWWPKGHRLVTEMAIKEGGFARFYTERARKYLIDRAPDMDFLQDQQTAMGEGMGESKAKLKEYRNAIKSNDRRKALRMWNQNELHVRPPAYMLMHGEAGLYKDKDASAKNEAVTSRLVDKAVALWSNNPVQSLSVLSDALHQAEDRGSHQEGNAFSGHDVRLKLNKYPWEKRHYKPNWQPDNADINKKGAVLAVGFAEGVLAKFKQGIGLQQGAKIDIRGVLPPVREVRKAGGWHTSKSSAVAGVATAMGGTFQDQGPGAGLEAMEDRFRWSKRWMERRTPQGEQSEYEKARQIPGVSSSLGDWDLLDKGIAFYEESVVYQDEFQAAVQEFRRYKKPRWKGGVSKSQRRLWARNYYNQRTMMYRGKKKERCAAAIKRAYKRVFNADLPL